MKSELGGCRRIPGLEAAVARLEAENAQLTASTSGAAVVREQLAEQQECWAAERKQARSYILKNYCNPNLIYNDKLIGRN